MSDYTDYMEEMFFAHVMNVREQLNDINIWINDYLIKREKYPDWVTRDGTHLPIGKIDDNHLDNLLNFVPEGTSWHKAFSYEKKYRRLCKLQSELKEEDKDNDKVIDTVYF